MSISTEITQILNKPRDPSVRSPDSRSLREVARKTLKDILHVLRKRGKEAEDGIGEINMGEDRLIRALIQTYRVAVEESDVDRPRLPPISLNMLNPRTLRQLAAGRDVIDIDARVVETASPNNGKALDEPIGRCADVEAVTAAFVSGIESVSEKLIKSRKSARKPIKSARVTKPRSTEKKFPRISHDGD